MVETNTQSRWLSAVKNYSRVIIRFKKYAADRIYDALQQYDVIYIATVIVSKYFE